MPFLLGLLAFLVLGAGVNCCRADAVIGNSKLIYFDPDSAQGNLGRLKDEMNLFLQGQGLDLEAQPVSRIDTFEQLMAQDEPIYVVVPRWYLDQQQAELLVPILASLTKGQPVHSKVIVVRRDSVLGPTDLIKRPVAMAAVNRQAAKQELNAALFAEHGLDCDEPRFIFTSRDYDSLIALLLGRVDAAVVVKRSLSRLADINPAMVKQLKTIAQSGPLPNPVLCRRGKDYIVDGPVIAALLASTGTKHSEKFMRLLGFDGWRQIVALDLRENK